MYVERQLCRGWQFASRIQYFHWFLTYLNIHAVVYCTLGFSCSMACTIPISELSVNPVVNFVEARANLHRVLIRTTLFRSLQTRWDRPAEHLIVLEESPAVETSPMMANSGATSKKVWEPILCEDGKTYYANIDTNEVRIASLREISIFFENNWF